VFRGNATAVPDHVRREMTGVSWHAHLEPPGFDELALVEVTHLDFEGAVKTGELVVAAPVADDIIGVFRQLFEAEFPIASLKRIDHFGGDDMASMTANNSSAFNSRRIYNTDRLSNHSYGLAVDINPLLNPVVDGDAVRPIAGQEFLDRADVRPGMIVRPGPVVAAFDAIGWEWGGDWQSFKDYHHFQRKR
jgi:hypothetical protein